jgi:ribosomal protein L37AE/L43A
MTTFTPPNCPKCSAPSIAPTRSGMGSTPYQCTRCGHAFSGLVIPSAMAKAQPFRLSIHETTVGHTVVIGPTGKGMSAGAWN